MKTLPTPYDTDPGDDTPPPEYRPTDEVIEEVDDLIEELGEALIDALSTHRFVNWTHYHATVLGVKQRLIADLKRAWRQRSHS